MCVVIGDYCVARPKDWSYAEHDEDADIEFDRFDKTVGDIAVRSLDCLSRDVTGLEADEHGWTQLDHEAFSSLREGDWLARLLVPPATATVGSRVAFNAGMASLRQALPFSEAERQWLFDDPDAKRRKEFGLAMDQNYVEAVRQSEAQLMSGGLRRVVHGRDLMQRWWSWRRETGEYADDRGGLNQARESLKDLIMLLTPELGLPESYTTLRQPSTLKPQSS